MGFLKPYMAQRPDVSPVRVTFTLDTSLQQHWPLIHGTCQAHSDPRAFTYALPWPEAHLPTTSTTFTRPAPSLHSILFDQVLPSQSNHVAAPFAKAPDTLSLCLYPIIFFFMTLINLFSYLSSHPPPEQSPVRAWALLTADPWRHSASHTVNTQCLLME